MWLELLVATGMVLLTVTIHGFGLALLGIWLRGEARAEHISTAPPLSRRAFVFTMMLVLGLFALHGIEVWLYALLYHSIGAVPDLRTAAYYSAATYGAIGFSDEAMAPEWRLLGAIEGLNGVLLLGWTTAFFVTVVGRLGRGRT